MSPKLCFNLKWAACESKLKGPFIPLADFRMGRFGIWVPLNQETWEQLRKSTSLPVALMPFWRMGAEHLAQSYGHLDATLNHGLRKLQTCFRFQIEFGALMRSLDVGLDGKNIHGFWNPQFNNPWITLSSELALSIYRRPFFARFEKYKCLSLAQNFWESYIC